jgi:DNA primase catalytic core
MMHENISYLKRIGWEPTSESGGELRGRCPYPHDHSGGVDSNPSFSINQDTGHFNCKACNNGGKSIISLIMLVERLGKEDAISKVFGENRQPDLIREIYRDLKNYSNKVVNSDKHPVHSKIVRDEIKKRNLPESVINKYGIGFVNEAVFTALHKKYSVKDLEDAGLVKEKSYFTANRISIPIVSDNQLVGFSLRAINNAQPKYINIFKDSYEKWFAFLNRKHTEVFITEGIFDALSMQEMGYNAIAAMGTDINRSRMNCLKSFDELYLMLDPDKAGVNAAKKFVDLSRGILDSTYLKVVSLPEGKDPDECDDDEIATAIGKSMPAFAWLVEIYADISEPEKFIIGMKKLRKMAERYQKDEFKILSTFIDRKIEHYTKIDICRFYEVDMETGKITKDYEVKE